MRVVRPRSVSPASIVRGTGVLVLAVAIVVAGGDRRAPAAEPSGLATPLVVRSVHRSHTPSSRPGAAPRAQVATRAQQRVTFGAPLDGNAVAAASGGLTIDVTLDDSITGNSEGAAIAQTIRDAITVYESLFADPIRVSILFRYGTTYADGTTPLPAIDLSVSETAIYQEPWQTYVGALVTDATTSDDGTANASLPGSALSTMIAPSSANGRAIGLNTPPVMFPDGSVGVGGPFDGIITLNARAPFSFSRPLASGTVDARRLTEHEIDEVLGLGSGIGEQLFRPQDLFSWAAPGQRGLSSSGARYFSIDAGRTELVGFNQEAGGDLGDWLSGDCPQATPYVQNAFSCPEQEGDVTATTPEAVNLDVIGYDRGVASTTTTTTASVTTTTAPPCAPPQVECCPLGQPGCGACGVDCGNGGCCALDTPVCDNTRLLCFPSGPSEPACGPDAAPCSDGALGFADVACCVRPPDRRHCPAACSPIVAACRASCAGTSRPKRCAKRCQSAIVGACRQSRPHACP